MFSKPKGADGNAADVETPRTSRTRTGWTPLVCEKGGTLQIRIACQRKGGARDLYSSAPAATKPRPTWAPVYDCELVSEQLENGQSKQKYKFKNMDNEVKLFDLDLLNPLIFGVNPFTQKVAAMLVQKKNRLLGMYVDLTSKSAEFCGHKEEHSDTGFLIADERRKEGELEDAGGTSVDLELFQKLAKEFAFKFGDKSDGDKNFRLSSFNKRKITDHFNAGPSKKVTKTHRTENSFRDAIEDEHGLEKTLLNSYVHFQHIEIDNLILSPKLFLPVDEANVRAIMDSMEEQFDPVGAVLTVCPEDLENYEGSQNSVNVKFHVMCGQHKFVAMQNLKRQGKLDHMKGFANGKMPCFICRTVSAAVTNHANIRSNDLSNKFKHVVGNEELLFVYSGLAKATKDPNEAANVVKKICHSRRTAPEIIAALQKMILWPDQVLAKLLTVLEKFRTFQTLDCAGGYGTKTKMRKRQPITMNKSELCQLGNCKPEFFAKNSEKVLANEKSLRTVLKESEEQNVQDRTMNSISLVAGHEDIKSLKERYPEKFDENVLRRYRGAEVYGRKKNEQGMMLANYVRSVKENKTIKNPVQVVAIESVKDVDAEKLNDCDVIVYDSRRSASSEFSNYLADFAGCTLREHLSVLIIFKDDSSLHEVVNKLEAWKDREDFKVKQIMFESNKTVSNQGSVVDNITFSLLFGKFRLFGGSLFSLQNGPVEAKLLKVVSMVCCPVARVAFVSGGGVDLIKVHKPPPEASDYEVTYYAPKKEIDRFVKKCTRGGLQSKKEINILDCLASKEEAENKAQQESSREGSDTDYDSDAEDVMDKEHETEDKEMESKNNSNLSESIERNPSTSMKNYCSPMDPDNLALS